MIKRKLGRTNDAVQYCEVADGPHKKSVACYNGGSCRADDGAQTGSSTAPCQCPEGTGGLQCELTCTLQCGNGGQCQFEGEDASSIPTWGQSEDGMFCRCRQGFVGLHCEQEAESCGPDGLICLTGSTCGQESHSKAYRCIQPRVNRCNPSSPNPEFYEGMAVVAFCLNEGRCREVMIGKELHPYCECAPGLAGPHCEYVARGEEPLPYSSPKIQQTSNLSHADSSGILALTLFLAGLLLLLTLLVRRQIRRIRRRRQQRMASINLQGFRDGGEDRNDEFAETSGVGRFIPTLPPIRRVKRKTSNDRRKVGGLRRAPSAVSRTPSFVQQRTTIAPSFAPKVTTSSILDSEAPRPLAGVSLTPSHVRRDQSFRLQRKSGIRPGTVAPDRFADPWETSDADDGRTRIQRSDSNDRGWNGWEMALEPEERGDERKSSIERALDMVSPHKNVRPVSRRKASFVSPSTRRVNSHDGCDSNFDDNGDKKMPNISFV